MTKLLQEAIATVEALPDEEQDFIAAEMLAIIDGSRDAGRDHPSVRNEDFEERDVRVVDMDELDQETRAAIEEGLSQARRGEFASDEDVARLFQHHRE